MVTDHNVAANPPEYLMQKKQSAQPSRSSAPRRLREILGKEDVTWTFEGRTYHLPIHYRRLSAAEGLAGPLGPARADGMSADQEHVLAIVVDWDDDMDARTRGELLDTLGRWSDETEEHADSEWSPGQLLRRLGEPVIATLEVSEYQYTDGIGSIVDDLDNLEGVQARGAGACAAQWLDDHRDEEWIDDFAVEIGTARYYRHLKVHPAFGGQGVATRLMAWSLACLGGPEATGTSILVAMPTHRDEAPDRGVDRLARLYAKLGFREIPDLREDGEAAVMVHHEGWGLPWDLERGFHPPTSAAPTSAKKPARGR